GKHVRPKQTTEVSNLTNWDQATFPHSVAGNVQLGFNPLTPYEWKTIYNKPLRLVHRTVSGASKAWLEKAGAQDWSLTHFDNLIYENDFANTQAANNHHRGFKWQFLQSGEELWTNDSVMFVVNAIEGGHALQGKVFHPFTDPFSREREQIERKVYDHLNEMGYARSSGDMSVRQMQREEQELFDEDLLKADILDELETNICSLKQLAPPIFMVTVGHFSYNGMVNQSLAYDVADGIFKPVIRRFFRIRVDDDPKFDADWKVVFDAPPQPVSVYGDSMINWLLDTCNGHRIHVDLKHAGYPTRRWFYQYAAEHGIKPIFSHGAVTGLSDIHYSPTIDEYTYADSKYITTFSPFSINLYDEEIELIYLLDGIMGISLDERRLGGYQHIGYRSREMRNALEGMRTAGHQRLDSLLSVIVMEFPELQGDRDAAFKLLVDDYISAEPFMQNLIYMLDRMYAYQEEYPVLKSRDPWHHVCLGSDFNGGIDPIDIVPTASQYPYFRNRLEQLLPIFVEINKKVWQRDYFNNGKTTLSRGLDYLFYESLRDFVRDNFIRNPVQPDCPCQTR
ncbi:MAG: hypothetical protein R3330_06335, partial [Saprospiraceae bacterium]|nr:hypothetical protein [Saprospiraceae bacterium]